MKSKPIFTSHADEIRYLSALCECGHHRGKHMVGDGGCDVDGYCPSKCQEFRYSPEKNFEAAMLSGGTLHDGTTAAND